MTRRNIPDGELLAATDAANAVAQAAQALLVASNEVVEMLRRHVLDWGQCSHPTVCGCSDGQARRFLADELNDPVWLEPAVMYTAEVAATPHARDDYPLHPNLHAIVFRQWGLMCDEIDLLRRELAEATACLQPAPEETLLPTENNPPQ